MLETTMTTDRDTERNAIITAMQRLLDGRPADPPARSPPFNSPLRKASNAGSSPTNALT
ncbi:hypothetical protein [Amycolatopsis sp. PS_44_ISF1]|uniref:hypothetical protein n=1 Tax=Amycolatopsis sp. PS_44_ISF1 TaxID=2974917 RepID=UPI0028DD9BDF|nr:hypothetical protein [Amycolatopsis sp. PS_44_ISF1]MDT8912229.1 hypothetical protein [Amycolatopsis sp. PS_44_ISF1]